MLIVSTVIRSNKKEQRKVKKADKNRSEIIEKFYSEASDRVEREYRNSPRKKYTKRKLCDIDDGEELWNFLEDSMFCLSGSSIGLSKYANKSTHFFKRMPHARVDCHPELYSFTN